MKKLLSLVLAGFLAFSTNSYAATQDKVVNIIANDDGEFFLPIFKAFEQATGIKVNTTVLDESENLLARVQAKQGENDVVFSDIAEDLVIAGKKGLLQPYNSSLIRKVVPANFRGPDWLGISYRARSIAYAPDRVDPVELSTYADLANPKWKGRICVRPGSHDYNISLLGNMIADIGYEATKKWLTALKANLAVTPAGNDRAQARNIYNKVCDVALVNTYYIGVMLANDEERAWGSAVKVFFPDQQGRGAHILINAVALLKGAKHPAEATKLLEFLVSNLSQQWMSDGIYQYPVVNTGYLSPLLKSFGAGQPGVRNGDFGIDGTSMSTRASFREAAEKLVDEVQFDTGK